jgi:type I restriction enzyme M protein
MLNKGKLNNLAGEIWKSAERLRGKFKAYEYQSVVLPIIVIRRIECVLMDWREKKKAEIKGKRADIRGDQLDEMVKKLELKQYHFSNTTHWTLSKITEEDPTLMEGNFRDYLNGFSENVQDIIDHFNYRAIVSSMKKNGRLSPILRQYAKEKLGPDKLSNLEMGYIYEELLRRFSEQSGEEAGEHFTPREVIRLMVELLDVQVDDCHVSIYDPACGTGGMLSVAKEHMLDNTKDDITRQQMDGLITLHGHELQPQNYAICKADMLIKNDKHAKIYFGNSLIPHDSTHEEPGDHLASADDHFDFMLSNPPFGVTWGGKDGYQAEAEKYRSTRYKAGMPRINDGALLFLQTMLAKMKPKEQGGSRIAIIFNGSPLSNGDCGSGESEIRRWILENDWLDAIVMLPDQLFYNTTLYTYVWLLTNNKPANHKGRVMLIDAREQFDKEPKAFGNKRNRILDSHQKWIANQYRDGWAKGFSDEKIKLFKTKDFAFHKVSVVFWQTEEHDQPAIITEPYEKAFTAANIKKELDFYDSEITFSLSLSTEQGETKTIKFILNPNDSFTKIYEKEVKVAFAYEIKTITKKITEARSRSKAIKAFIKELAVNAEFTHRHYIKDDEYIPYGEDVPAFLEREIKKPIIRWEDAPQLGYEILPNKYFYRYQPPKPAKELLQEFWVLEKEAEGILAQLEGAI